MSTVTPSAVIERGSNIPHKINTSIDLRTAVKLEITYSQQEREVITKTLEDCTVEEKYILVAITQAESLRFREKLLTEVQIRVKLASGDVFPSKTVVVNTGRLLKEGMI